MIQELLSEDTNNLSPAEALGVTPELVEAVDQAFIESVEEMDSLLITPEEEAKMGASNKPVISTDHHLGAKS